MKFFKKPIMIEAFQVDSDFKYKNGILNVPAWAMEAYREGKLYFKACEQPTESLQFKANDGDFQRVNVGDFIVRDMSGEFYLCKSDIFEKTYMHVGDEDDIGVHLVENIKAESTIETLIALETDKGNEEIVNSLGDVLRTLHCAGEYIRSYMVK